MKSFISESTELREELWNAEPMACSAAASTRFRSAWAFS